MDAGTNSFRKQGRFLFGNQRPHRAGQRPCPDGAGMDRPAYELVFRILDRRDCGRHGALLFQKPTGRKRMSGLACFNQINEKDVENKGKSFSIE